MLKQKGKSPQRRRRRLPLLLTDHERFVPYLLEDHTVPQLSVNMIPTRCKHNANPYSAPLPNPHRALAVMPTRDSSLRHKYPESIEVEYHRFHELQCPKCQQGSRANVQHQLQAVFQKEKSTRDSIEQGEVAERSCEYKSMLIEYKRIRSILKSKGAHREPIDPAAQASEFAWQQTALMDMERGRRFALMRLLWRQLRALHYSLSVAPGIDLDSVSQRMEALEPIYCTLVETMEHALTSRCDTLESEEAAARMSVEEDYATSTSLLEIASCSWRASATKSHEQRVVAEQAKARGNMSELEQRVRSIVVNDEEASWLQLVNQHRARTRVFFETQLEAMIIAMQTKEDRIRQDRQTMYLGEREAMLIRSLVEAQDVIRKQTYAKQDFERQSGLVEPHQLWLSERTDADTAECRANAAEVLCREVVKRALTTFDDPSLVTP